MNDTTGALVGFLIAAVLFLVAGYFGWQARATLGRLRADAELARDQRRYFVRRCWRRLFGSFLLLIVAVMLIGTLLMLYEIPAPDGVATLDSVHFLVGYVTCLLLAVLLVLVVALFDFWATARYAVDQRKQLVREHKALLKAELAQQLRRRAEMN